jgi:hypothetical protein
MNQYYKINTIKPKYNECQFNKTLDKNTFHPLLKYHILLKKSKAVPLHAMEAHGGRGGIAPTHS